MIQWHRYQRADGEWAEFGAFVLEASSNGSWVVRHKMGEVPCRCSADLGGMQPGGIDSAKAACEKILAEILAAPSGNGALVSTSALKEQKAITVALCKRHMAVRALQAEAAEKNTEEHTNKANAAQSELDRRIKAYIDQNT
jgi:hypothetical protein